MAMLPMPALRAQADTTARPEHPTPPAHEYDTGYDRSVVSGLSILGVADGGTFITLQDGTEWEVDLPDRTSTVGWRQGDFVLVRLAPIARGRYQYRLVNGRDDSEALVKFRGRKSAGE
jgi:hypothetical protein